MAEQTTIHSSDTSHIPEAVEIPSYPEVVPTSHNTLPRYPSLHRPEVRGKTSDKYPVHDQQAYDGHGLDHTESPTLEKQTQRKRTICGLRPVIFVSLCVLAILVVLGAVLGGVLGTVLRRSDTQNDDNASTPSTVTANSTSNTEATTISNDTQLALLYPAGSNALFTYFSRPGGVLTEAAYPNSSWQQAGYVPTSLTNITSNARDGTPVSAIAYNNSGTVQKQIFYLDPQGYVSSVQKTGDGSWTEPAILFMDDAEMQAVESSNMLTACVSQTEDRLNGIRLIYGLETGSLQQAQLLWPQPVHNITTTTSFISDQSVGGVDVSAGAGCTYGSDDKFRLYYRGNGTGAIWQGTIDFGNTSANNFQFTWNSVAPVDELPARGSVLSVTNDGALDYFVYQDSNDNIVKTSAIHDRNISSVQTNQQSLNWAPTGHGMATLYSAETGWLVVNQNKSAPAELGNLIFSEF